MRNRHRSRLLVAILALTAPLAKPAVGTEHGNLFGKADEASREASAKALQGLSDLMLGLKARELRDLELGKQQLVKAEGSLREAASLMAEVKIPPEQNLPLETIVDDADRRVVAVIAGRFGGKEPEDLVGAYRLLQDMTEILMNKVAAAETNTLDQPVTFNVAPLLADYLLLGMIVTRAGQTANGKR